MEQEIEMLKLQEELDKTKAKNQELESNYNILKSQYLKQKEKIKYYEKELRERDFKLANYERHMRMQDQNIRTLKSALEDKKC